MGLAGLWTCLVLAGSVCLASGDHQAQGIEAQQVLPKLSSPDAEPLFLTPLIKNCNYTEAKEKSKVEIFKTANVTANAYSGYITVNAEKENNLFFLFIEAENNATDAPLLLWTPGGPGLSALFAMLLQNGPVQFDATGNLSRRELTIQKNMSVIYLDAPVGAGLSFTNNSGYATEMKNITSDILEFLDQFLQLFERYRGRDFYAGGDSYAARYSVALAYEMLKTPSNLSLNFQGVIGGVGFLAPILDLADSSDFLLETSMLTRSGHEIFKKQFETMRNLTAKYDVGNYTMALRILFSSSVELRT
uniref:Putative serine carboxypeptidase lysosomal cathepsin a n=1 Tax=Amblyomma americanum TaxID=6943 RepID=A0A0C9S5J1_AMBAM